MAAPGGIARAIAVLREAGLAEALRPLGVTDGGDLDLAEPRGLRGPSGLLDEDRLVALVEAVRARVADVRARGRSPLLVGGDCPVLLGALAAVAAVDGEPGLLMVDGHEDAWPPPLSPTGETSDSELGIALGLFGDGLPVPLDRPVPLVAAGRVALLGPRDRAEIEAGGVSSVRDRVALFCDEDEVRQTGASRAAARALGALGAGSEGRFWLHVDLDVLSSHDFSAADYLQPGGLTWDELDAIAGAALAAPNCAGASVVIYNPDRDPARTVASSVVEFVARLAQG